MRVRRGDREMAGVVAVGRLAVEGPVARPAQRTGRLVQQRRARRPGAVDGANEAGVVDPIGPRHAERAGAAADGGQRRRFRRGQRPQEADPALDHDASGGHTRQERDLGIPPLDGKRDPVLEPEPIAIRDGSLLGAVQADTAAFPLDLLAEQPHGAQQHQRIIGPSGVQLDLDAVVLELGAAADDRPLHFGIDVGTGVVEVDAPQQRGPVAIG